MFWSIAVHRYYKQCSVMTIFVAKGLRLKLVINGIFMTKKIKNVCNVAQKKANIM